MNTRRPHWNVCQVRGTLMRENGNRSEGEPLAEEGM
jgi:hypothetical protein